MTQTQSIQTADIATAPSLRTELPGPKAREVLDRDGKITSPSLPRAYPLVPRRGTGSVIEDVDGNLFLDFNAGIAVNSTGHAHPKVVQAVQRQAEDLLHYSASDFFLPIYSQMCQALARTAPMSGPVRVFLSNSGAEAVEGAMKLARHSTGRPYIIGFHGAFHGRSYGALTLTASKAKYHKGFGPLLPGVLHVPFGTDETFTALEHHLRTAGRRRPRWPRSSSSRSRARAATACRRPGWLARLREVCDKHGILLVADEVQSGMGRTGKMWAIEHAGVEPDVLISRQGHRLRPAARRVSSRARRS